MNSNFGSESLSRFPKVLIVSESPFSLDNGFGVTLTNFFEGWPSANLSVFYISSGYQLLNRDCIFQKHAEVPGNPRGYSLFPFILSLQPEFRSQYSAWWLHRKLNGFQPEVVYTFLHSDSTFRFGQWISEQLDIPHVMHVGDDGLDSSRETNE